jgi:hypothetical protein
MMTSRSEVPPMLAAEHLELEASPGADAPLPPSAYLTLRASQDPDGQAMASLAAAGLRIAGYGVMGVAQHNQALVIVFYLLPLLGTAGAIAVLAGYSPSSLRERFKVQTA